jgi:hypothetical protein
MSIPHALDQFPLLYSKLKMSITEINKKQQLKNKSPTNLQLTSTLQPASFGRKKPLFILEGY